MVREILSVSSFEGGESVGGMTGSLRVKDKVGNYYQLKQSITKAPWSAASVARSMKAKGTDSELFSEIISSIVSEFVTESNTEGVTKISPSLNLVYDETAILCSCSYCSG